jgi:hypothetical protein
LADVSLAEHREIAMPASDDLQAAGTLNVRHLKIYSRLGRPLCRARPPPVTCGQRCRLQEAGADRTFRGARVCVCVRWLGCVCVKLRVASRSVPCRTAREGAFPAYWQDFCLCLLGQAIRKRARTPPAPCRVSLCSVISQPAHASMRTHTQTYIAHTRT